MSWFREGTKITKSPETGFPIAGVRGPEVTAKSRYENFRGGSTKEFTNKTNKTVIQRGFIYVKKGEPTPKKFETVKVVAENGEVMFEGEVLNVYNGQLNTTIAV